MVKKTFEKYGEKRQISQVIIKSSLRVKTKSILNNSSNVFFFCYTFEILVEHFLHCVFRSNSLISIEQNFAFSQTKCCSKESESFMPLAITNKKLNYIAEDIQE